MRCFFVLALLIEASADNTQSRRTDFDEGAVEREVVMTEGTTLIVALRQDNGEERLSLRAHCETTLLTTLVGCKSAEFLRKLEICILAFHDRGSALAARDTADMSPLTAASDLTGRSLAVVPNDLRYDQQRVATDADRPAAWDALYRDSQRKFAIVVAVVDSGIDYTHPDLKDHLWQGEAKGGYDMVANTADPMDFNGHGTHCAGTILAQGNNNRLGDTGALSLSVQVMALKVDISNGLFDASAILRSIDRMLELEVQISSHSYTIGSNIFPQIEQKMRINDHLMIAAAGNGGRNLDQKPTLYPCCLASSNIICVTGLKKNSLIWEGSNYGKTCVDIAAPGVGILSTKPGGSYEERRGTSFATPIVAGVAAYALRFNSNLTSTALKQTIRNSVILDVLLKEKVKWSGRIDESLLAPIYAGPNRLVRTVIMTLIALSLLVVITTVVRFKSKSTTKNISIVKEKSEVALAGLKTNGAEP